MQTDVAVIGAGPAGAWAACCFARRGARVALIDASHPREKPCGGGVTGRALALVGSDIAAAAVDLVLIRSARFRDARTGRSAVVPLSRAGAATVAVASREQFDGALMRLAVSAGASLIQSRASAVTRSGSRWLVACADGRQIGAAFVIGADGANSLVRRRVLVPFTRDQLSIGTGFFAHGVSSDEMVLELDANPPGYLWSFPRTDHLAIGVCAQATAASASSLRSRAARWIAATALAPGARLRPYSWPIPSLARRDLASVPFAGPGWLLAGDAAGLVDPITREGIYFALRSGELAADAITSGVGDYDERIRDEIVPDLEAAAMLKAGFFRPRFTALLMRGLAESAEIRTVMADLIAGAQSYRGLKWRLLKTLQVRMAFDLLRSG